MYERADVYEGSTCIMCQRANMFTYCFNLLSFVLHIGPPGPAFSFPVNKFARTGLNIMAVTYPPAATTQADVQSLHKHVVTTGFIADLSICGNLAAADYGKGTLITACISIQTALESYFLYTNFSNCFLGCIIRSERLLILERLHVCA
jgi:hypothetical protein